MKNDCSNQETKCFVEFAGIAEYFNVDPTIVRIAVVFFGIIGGTGILAYIVAAIIIPEKPADID